MQECGSRASGSSRSNCLATWGSIFLEHLADGDAASNTLSWRWVAGLQTKGKRYKASSHNIETYTKGRFKEILVNENPKLELEYKHYPSQEKFLRLIKKTARKLTNF